MSRFRTRHHFASYNGTAPVDSSSGGGPPAYPAQHQCNRKLNYAIHMVAITQVRNDCAGRAFYLRKQAEGKTPKEALRALKRCISDVIYRHRGRRGASSGPRARRAGCASSQGRSTSAAECSWSS